MKKLLTKWLRYRSYKKAVKSATHLSRMYNKKYLVILYNGKFKAFQKQLLKALYDQGKFKKGLNFRQIEKMAVYSTH